MRQLTGAKRLPLSKASTGTGAQVLLEFDAELEPRSLAVRGEKSRNRTGPLCGERCLYLPIAHRCHAGRGGASPWRINLAHLERP